jgi:sulfur-carrier protein
MKVYIPSPLHSYTGGRSTVDGVGSSIVELLTFLEARYPGIRFRIVDEQDQVRPHIRFFVGGELAPTIRTPIAPGEDVQIICALSGG